MRRLEQQHAGVFVQAVSEAAALCIFDYWGRGTEVTVFSDGSKPKVTVHVLPDEVVQQGDSAQVTLVCLVSSPVLQDFYIAWAESKGRNAGTYKDGINFPPQKSKDGYLVTSVYTTDNWNTRMIECNVWPAGSDSSESKGVSKTIGNYVECNIQ
ncbi:Ig heavy chain Mem5-like [Symphorus nematophorus]